MKNALINSDLSEFFPICLVWYFNLISHEVCFNSPAFDAFSYKNAKINNIMNLKKALLNLCSLDIFNYEKILTDIHLSMKSENYMDLMEFCFNLFLFSVSLVSS